MNSAAAHSDIVLPVTSSMNYMFGSRCVKRVLMCLYKHTKHLLSPHFFMLLFLISSSLKPSKCCLEQGQYFDAGICQGWWNTHVCFYLRKELSITVMLRASGSQNTIQKRFAVLISHDLKIKKGMRILGSSELYTNGW